MIFDTFINPFFLFRKGLHKYRGLTLALIAVLGTVPPMHALSPYHMWRHEAFGADADNPSIADDTANPDHDSLPNLFEYALGRRPNSPDHIPTIAKGVAGVSFAFTHDSGATGITLTVQGSDDLKGAWTDLAESTNGLPFISLIDGVEVNESGNETIKQVLVTDRRDTSKNTWFLRLKVERNPTQTVAAIMQGQSNAVDMLTNAAWFGGDAGYTSIFKGLVQDLTGVPNVVVYGNAQSWDVGNRTAVGGTYLYKSGSTSQVWMDVNSANASTWPLLDIGLECDNYIRTNIRGQMGDMPLAFLRIHSEYDGLHSTDAVYYAAANNNFVAKMREAADISAWQMPVFYGQIPYHGGKSQGLDALRVAWADDVEDPAMNARYAWSSVNDGPYFTDNVHMGIEACRQAHARMAFAYARWLYDNGYANTDLSTLPTTGPIITGFCRGPSANQIDIKLNHDTGTDIVIPENVNLAGFAINDPNSSQAPVASSAERIDATTIRLTLDKDLSRSDKITLDYLGYVATPFSNVNLMYGIGNLITDNYHLLEKPHHVTQALTKNYSSTSIPSAPAEFKIPIARMVRAITIDP